MMIRCASCHTEHPMHRLFQVDRLVARQTHSSPAEYEEALICHDCFHRGEVDDVYERANVVWKEQHGGEL